MRHLVYLGVLAAASSAVGWLDPVLRLGVWRRWRRLVVTVAVVAVVFGAWDLAAVAAKHWSYDPAQTLTVRLPGGLPVEEVLFFVVVPVCAVMTHEAVRQVIARRGRRARGSPARRARQRG